MLMMWSEPVLSVVAAKRTDASSDGQTTRSGPSAT
jgi:hypothetical protein